MPKNRFKNSCTKFKFFPPYNFRNFDTPLLPPIFLSRTEATPFLVNHFTTKTLLEKSA